MYRHLLLEMRFRIVRTGGVERMQVCKRQGVQLTLQ